MPFTTYSELITAVGTWMGGRTDLDANIPDAITLFEAEASRRLKLRPTETSTTLTPSSGSATLPSDFLGVVRATVTSSSRVEMQYVSPSYLQMLYPTGISDTPRFYTIEGSTFKTRSSDSTGIEFVYNAKTAAVSSSLNWLFTNHPDAYLFGTLSEMMGFTDDIDSQRAGYWKSRRDEAFSSIGAANFRERGPMSIRIDGAHP